MNSRYEKKLYLGFLNMHILYHASKEPIYGVWMIEELNHHGYHVGPSHIYPILKEMVKEGLLEVYENSESGRMRKYYRITERGKEVLTALNTKLKELTGEVRKKEAN